MYPRTPTVENDIVDATREDDIESLVVEARERWEACDESDRPRPARPSKPRARTRHLVY
jgi:hypothetical protein